MVKTNYRKNWGHSFHLKTTTMLFILWQGFDPLPLENLPSIPIEQQKNRKAAGRRSIEVSFSGLSGSMKYIFQYHFSDLSDQSLSTDDVRVADAVANSSIFGIMLTY
jgi:hypothetical protein